MGTRSRSSIDVSSVDYMAEAEIRKSPIVGFAIMFGRERNQTGVLIELKPEAQGRSLDAAGRASLIDEIW